MKKLNHIFLAILIITTFVCGPIAFSQGSTEQSTTFEIAEWLQLGPFQTALPAFDNGNVKLSDLLAFQEMDVSNWWPSEKQTVDLNKSQRLQWKKVSGGKGGAALGRIGTPQIVYLASYLSANRFVKAELKVVSPHLFQIYLDGVVIGTKSSSEKLEDKDGSASEIKEAIKLETGKHLLLIKTVSDPENKSDWSVKASLEVGVDFGGKSVSVGTSPEQIMSIHRLLDGPKITGVSVSPDGEFMSISYSQTQPPTDDAESWIEIRRTSDNRLVETLRGGLKVANVKWSPEKGVFSYTKTNDQKTDLWIVSIDGGKNFPVLQELKNFEEYNWSPDGSFIVYSITEKPENKDAKVKRWKSLKDRWPYFRDRSSLYQVSVPEGVQRRLSAGKLTTQLLDISPDGKKLLITQYTDDYNDRPYHFQLLGGRVLGILVQLYFCSKQFSLEPPRYLC